LREKFTARSKKSKKLEKKGRERKTTDFADRTDFFGFKFIVCPCWSVSSVVCFEEEIYRKVKEAEKVEEKGKRKKNHRLRGQNGLF
jgi:hypothetical protein